MRLGILGGTFDPPHLGHLLAASDAFEVLELDRLAFVPAGEQPLKSGQVIASAAERLAMTRLMVDGDTRFEVDPLEIEREGLSYTVRTLEDLSRRHSGAALFLLVGEDVLGSFDQWREPERVRELAEMVVLRRTTWEMPVVMAAGARVIPTRRVEISSTEIRTRVRDGRSIRGFVADAVREFIETAGLYR